MFKGIIRYLGIIINLINNNESNEIIITIRNEAIIEKLTSGDSVAVSGVCLTVTQILEKDFIVYVSAETYEKTNLKFLKVQEKVNLETSLKYGETVDGHLIQGHVEGVCKIVNISKAGESSIFIFSLPKELEQFIAHKGSVALNGVSSTVNDVVREKTYLKDKDFELKEENIINMTFAINIIPHTFYNTTFQYFKIGDSVNIEIDLIARYLLNFYKYYQK